MRFVADLHVHSRFSRATSREADLDGYHRWARIKGISVVGTGDFTHPGWLKELEEKLVEKDGLYELKEPPRGSPLEGLTPADTAVRFIPTAEISSIYKKRGQVRKVHSLIGVRSLEQARKVGGKLAAIGNVASDGRPILGLDPKDLFSILLDVAPDAFLIPAHVWTPWFSLFGSRSGFDLIEDCFEELTPLIFALETGLSSDPPMNWRWSALDGFRLVSNSDAHSPPNLGREANLFDTEQSWDGIVRALRTGEGFDGTFEFYPEEGKYHFDGHRACGVCLDPAETPKTAGLCPVCGKPVTVGVLARVLALADRPSAVQPRQSEGFRYIIPLPEMLSELTGAGAGSRAVTSLYARIIGAFGSEYAFLLDSAIEDIRRSQGTLLAEAVRRMREGRIDPRPGYDGQFGVIRVFDDAELSALRGQDELFPRTQRAARRERGRGAGAAATAPAASPAAPPPASPPDGPPRDSLDADQGAVAASAARFSVVHAGPGAGKTRLLVDWIRRALAGGAVEPRQVLALTFTNKAADELKERLARAMPRAAAEISAFTFHSFCWSVLRGRDPSLATLYAPGVRPDLLSALMDGELPFEAAECARRMERCWEGMDEPDAAFHAFMEKYENRLRWIGAADISALVGMLVRLLDADPSLQGELAGRYRIIAVDEMQDINRPQYDLLKRLCAASPEPGPLSVLCIGDPDQAIYGFRGSDRTLFFRFAEETGATVFTLSRNYRSTATIVAAADVLISSSRGSFSAVRPAGARIRVLAVRDPREEGRSIAEAIRDLVGGVDAVSVDAARTRQSGNYAFSDIAVLFRTRAVRDALFAGLGEAGLPFTFGANAPLADEEPFRFLMAALRLVSNPDDPLSRRLLVQHAAALGRSEDTVEDFIARRDALAHEASTRGICAVMDEALDSVVSFDRSVPAVALGEEMLRASAERHGGDLAGFLARVSLCVRESESIAAEKISLLTFHAAKGLEFRAVFIAGAEEGITPLGQDLEEERRLFYVAFTRARDYLCITHCATRRIFGRDEKMAPSRFIGDIPATLRVSEKPRPKDRQLSLW
jgi:DNA helicase II / ATP-dependent DNA helicase PcrA